jgi:anthranilate phosphoribosyltransferase
VLEGVGLWFLRSTIGYGLGNRYFRVLRWVFGLSLLGMFVLIAFGTQSPALWSWLSLFFASLDQLLPIITLNKAYDVLIFGDPSAQPPIGPQPPWVLPQPAGVQYYFYWHTIVGWVLASFIVAGAGVPVAKHGNRALSSRSGAADVLSSLGVRIDIKPDHVGRCVAEAGIGFMFAPSHHPAMKNVGPTRVELATRTIFNLLGPLSNPAGVKRQMVGVFSRQWVQPLAQVLKNLGAESAWVVHGSDGLDEITLTGPSFVAALENGNIRTFEVTPEEAGLDRVGGDALKGGDADANAIALQSVLDGKPSPFRDVALLNAAAALIVAGRAKNLKEGVALGTKSLDSGAAAARLKQLIAVSNG